MKSLPRAFGWTLFGTGFAAWCWTSYKTLPYIYHDRYLFALKWNDWEMFELPHPLFQPLLGAYRSVLTSAGYTGTMLMPLELLNLAAGALTLAVLFVLAVRIGRNALLAAVAVLGVGFSPGFHEAALRPAPYSLTAAFAVLTLACLLESAPEHPRRHSILAGIAAGLTVAFHTAGLVLVPAAAASFRPQGRARRPASRPLIDFIAAMSAVVAVSYVALALYHGFSWHDLSLDPREIFRGVEQVPGTSLYSSRDPVLQLRDFMEAFRAQAGPFGLVAASFVGFIFLLRALGLLRGEIYRPCARLSLVFIASLAFFFAFNNSRNGLIYAIMLPVPLLLAALTPERPLSLALLAPAALGVAVIGGGRDLPGASIRNWIPSEISYLNALLKPGEFVVTPACPPPDLLYQKRFDFLHVGDLPCRGNGYVVPQEDWETLPGRISAAFDDGRRVYYWPGPPDADLTFSGHAARREDETAAKRLLPAYRERVDSSFLMDCKYDSPNGWKYCELLPRPGVRPRGLSSLAGLGVVTPDDIAAVLGLCPAERDRRRIEYLTGWLAESPGDAYVKRELRALVAADCKKDVSRALARPGRLKSAEEAFARMFPLDDAEGLASLGRRGEALAALRRADSFPLDDGELQREAELYRTLGQTGRYSEIERRLAAKRPKDAGRVLDLAESLASLGRRDEALAALRRVEAASLDDAGLKRAADVYLRLREPGGFVRTMERLLGRHPDDAALRLGFAEGAESLGRRDEAAAALSRAEAGPLDDPQLRRAAELERRLGEPGRSMILLGRLAAKHPGDAGLGVDLAEDLASLGRRDEALAALTHAESLRPDESGLRRMAREYQVLGAYPQALSIWKKITQRPRPAAKDFSDKAVADFLAGRPEEAMADCKEAIRLDPRDLDAYVSLGSIYASQGRCGDALAVYAQAAAVKIPAGQEPARRQIIEARDALRPHCPPPDSARPSR